MNKFWLTLLLQASFFIVPVLAESVAPLLGSWKADSPAFSFELILNQDGTFRSITIREGITFDVVGSYSSDGTEIVLHTERGDDVAFGYTLTGSTLLLQQGAIELDLHRWTGSGE